MIYVMKYVFIILQNVSKQEYMITLLYILDTTYFNRVQNHEPVTNLR